MTEVISFVLLLPIGVLSLMALFTVVQVLFSAQIQHVQKSLEGSAKRSFVMGLINFVFVAAIALALIAVGENAGAPIFAVLGLLIGAIGVVGLIFGLVGISQLVGAQLQPERSRAGQLVIGTLVLTLACLFPFLGWFVLFPYVGILGFGGYLNGVAAARRARKSSE